MKWLLRLIYIIISITLSYESQCFYDEYYNSITSTCKKCTSILNGCLRCIERLPSTILCLECLSAYTQGISSNEITSCIAECTYPTTVLNDILPKGPISDCQMALWINKQLDEASFDLLNNIKRETSPSELNALGLLYKSLNGDIWVDNTHWNIGDPCINHWKGIECNTRGNIIGISFSQNGLNGVIPDIISDLSHLTYIHITNILYENTLATGNRIFKVSPLLFQLPKIRDIMISNVNLRQDLGTLIAMNSYISNTIEIIDLSFNRLYGVLPSFASFIFLKIVNFSSNDVSGKLDMLDTLPSTVYDISLHNNLFNGIIPNLNNVINSLEYLDLRNTSVTGTIPSNLISNAYFNQLQYIGLMMTNVTIPNECKDTPFCIKRLMQQARSIYDSTFTLTSDDTKYLKPRP